MQSSSTESLVVENIGEALQRMKKDDLLVSCDFKCLHRTAGADKNRTWPAIETSYRFKNHMNDAVFEMFNSSRCDELSRSAFLTVKSRNPEIKSFNIFPQKKN